VSVALRRQHRHLGQLPSLRFCASSSRGQHHVDLLQSLPAHCALLSAVQPQCQPGAERSGCAGHEQVDERRPELCRLHTRQAARQHWYVWKYLSTMCGMLIGQVPSVTSITERYTHLSPPHLHLPPPPTWPTDRYRQPSPQPSPSARQRRASPSTSSMAPSTRPPKSASAVSPSPPPTSSTRPKPATTPTSTARVTPITSRT
jgi:hypothetical protein